MHGTRGTTGSEGCLLLYSGVGKSLIKHVRYAGVSDMKLQFGMSFDPFARGEKLDLSHTFVFTSRIRRREAGRRVRQRPAI